MKRVPLLRSERKSGRLFAPAKESTNRMTQGERPPASKTKTILAIWITIVAICVSVQRTAAARPSETTNPFAGTYYGFLDSLNYGSMTISDSGRVSGYFSYSK
jgi:hypothetical protein